MSSRRVRKNAAMRSKNERGAKHKPFAQKRAETGKSVQYK